MPREYPFVPLQFERLPAEVSRRRAREIFEETNRRRTTRHSSTDPVPRELVEYAIRAAAEAGEYENYRGRTTAEWDASRSPTRPTRWHS